MRGLEQPGCAKVFCDLRARGFLPKSLTDTWGYALYVFSPGTDGKKFEAPSPGLLGQIDSAMAGAESRPPRREQKLAAKRGWQGRDFFLVRRRLRKCRFLQTLSVKVRFCIRYRLRTGKKFVFGTRSRLRTGKKFTPPRRRAPEKKLCIFSFMDGEKVRFLHTLSVTGGKNNAFG